MVDETDMSEEKKWFYQERARVAVANLQRRNTNAQYVSSRQEALSTVIEMIPNGAMVACGDSVSLDQVEVISELRKRGQNSIIHPMERDADGFSVVTLEERLRMQREAFFADIFLTGTNAVTLDGKLVCTDGLGNRVAAMLFGPKKVIIVAGANKIVKNVDEAVQRIKEVCAPLNNIRHDLKHRPPGQPGIDLPCVRTGYCTDCKQRLRSCSFTVVIHGPGLARNIGFPDPESPSPTEISIIIIGERLGI